MRSLHRFGLAAALVLCSALASVLAAPDLPGEVVTHWNAAGDPDGYADRWVALVGLPALSTLLLAGLSRRRPRRSATGGVRRLLPRRIGRTEN